MTRSIRVYELARELGVQSKDILRLLREHMNIELDNHMAAINDQVARRVTQLIRGEAAGSPAKGVGGSGGPQAARPQAGERPAAPGGAGRPARPQPPQAGGAGRPASPGRPPQAAAAGAARTGPAPQGGAGGAPRGTPPAAPAAPAGARGAGAPPAGGAAPAGRPAGPAPASRPAAPATPAAAGQPGGGVAARGGAAQPRPGTPAGGGAGGPQTGRPQDAGRPATPAAAAASPAPAASAAAPVPGAASAPAGGDEAERAGGPAARKRVRRRPRGFDLLAEGAPEPELEAELAVPVDEERLLARSEKVRRARGRPAREEDRDLPGAPRRKPREISLSGPITVAALAEKLGIKAAEAVRTLVGMGVMASANQEVDLDTAAILAEEYGASVRIEEDAQDPFAIEPQLLEDPEARPEDEQPRPPVVTVMGHVDHGKTTLLDAIRNTNVTAQEAGGITQHIGASVVQVGDRRIVFLDTPGHEAFTALRARGAQVTDIAVLVVAADDGVMPQTVEAINHAKAAGVPIVVAINKVDKPGANVERVKQQLVEHGLIPEDWGGDTVCVPVSALRREGIDELLEMILLVADLRELKANPKRRAYGTVIEASLEKGRGPVGTVLVQNGTLRVGDPFICGTSWGRVRAMIDDKGRPLKEAGPSTPVVVLGFDEVPQAGQRFIVMPDERSARELAERRREWLREREQHTQARAVSLEEFYRQLQEGEVRDLNLIVKADVQGSVDALRPALERLGNEEVRVRVIHAGVGAITESDVMLAAASRAVIIGFNVRPEPSARKAAEQERVDVRTYRVIYDVLDDVKKAVQGMLAPEVREVVLGRAEVRRTFRVPGVGTVAGCYVLEGELRRNAKVRLLRDGKVVYEGAIASLKRFQEDVREVRAGYECGVGLERFQDIREGDVIEAFTLEEVRRSA